MSYFEPKVDINPCPCGNTYMQIGTEHDKHGWPKPGTFIRCRQCGRRTKLHRRYIKAVRAWNAQYANEIFIDKRVIVFDI